MKINKTQRRVGIHKLAMPKATMPKLIKTPKFPSLPKLPKVKQYGSFPKGHVY